jgi:hypothetical protein
VPTEGEAVFAFPAQPVSASSAESDASAVVQEAGMTDEQIEDAKRLSRKLRFIRDDQGCYFDDCKEAADLLEKIAACSGAESAPIGWVNLRRKGLPDSFVWAGGDPEFRTPVFVRSTSPTARADVLKEGAPVDLLRQAAHHLRMHAAEYSHPSQHKLIEQIDAEIERIDRAAKEPK